MSVRVFLTERMSIESEGVVLDEQRFPGRQGRLVFAYLLAARGRPVPKDELADALWGDFPPARWEKALSVLVSKLRVLVVECGLDGTASLASVSGCYALTLPPGTWIDIAMADEAAAAAERALSSGDLAAAVTNGSTAASLARRTFLPGESLRWVDEARAELRETLLRSLECLAEALRLSGDAAAAVRAADELVTLEPFRDGGYRLLMQAQSAAGNDAEALRTYERCRALLAEELGAYPSPETEALYLEILRSSPLGSDDAQGSAAPPGSYAEDEPPRRNRRVLAGLVAAALLVILAAVAVGAIVASGDAAPPEVMPNSLVRIDPETLQPTQVVQVGNQPDLVVAAGGYVWVTHEGRRYVGSTQVRDAGTRTLWRVDPSTGKTDVVGGGLAPCGLTDDPSGDVWVANCFAPGSGQVANVVRVDATTLNFEATRLVPAGAGYFRGLAYGGGWLWAADVSGAVDYHGITKVDPRTPLTSRIELDRHAGWLSWSDGYGDLWMNDFERGSVSRMHASTRAIETFESVATNPAAHVVDGDTFWVSDWANPDVIRMPAVGSGKKRRISLPATAPEGGVTNLDAGAGAVWATVPDSHAVWRIDTKTNRVTRIALGYAPWGIAVGEDGVWVAVRRRPA